MKIVLGRASSPSGYRLVVIDRFYSSVALAIELLTMGLYVLGAIMTARIGFDKRVREKRQTRPRGLERGSFLFSRSVAIPTMIACRWWDRKPVHYLATGPSMTEDTIRRNLKGQGGSVFKCPKLVTDYQRWMGGVDVHDQLRLQAYSVQTSIRFQKYYKSLFIGFLDMAFVNAYITHKTSAISKRVTPKDRGEWYLQLHKQLLQLKEEDFASTTETPGSATPRSRKRRRGLGHKHTQLDEWMTVSGVQKRRQRVCKVCGLLRGDRKKSFQTTWFCEDCSQPDAKCYLCRKARRTYGGISKTCFRIWHDDFDCGNNIPASLGKRVVLRRAGKAGARKPTRRELIQQQGDEADDEEQKTEN